MRSTTVLLVATTLAALTASPALAKLHTGHHDGITLPERVVHAVERHERLQSRAERADPTGIFRRQDSSATCDSGYSLCSGKHATGCCQAGATCCGDGGCCSAGYKCYTYEKKKGCCPENKVCSGFTGTCTTSQYFPCQEDNNACCPLGAKCNVNEFKQVTSCGKPANISSAAGSSATSSTVAKPSGTLAADNTSSSALSTTPLSARLALPAAAVFALAGAWLL